MKFNKPQIPPIVEIKDIEGWRRDGGGGGARGEGGHAVSLALQT